MQKKQLLLKTCENLDQEFINIIKEPEKKNGMRQMIRGIGLKSESEGKCKEVEILIKIIHVLEEKRKKLQ